MAPKNKKICVYCGQSDPETKDHVPPKGIFALSRPTNLKTVPCCQKCHSNTSKDDEYFRTMLAMRHDTFDHPDVQGVLPKVYRSLAYKEQRGFLKSILKTIEEKEVKTPAGIYLGKKSFYDVDFNRLDSVVERIVRGLYSVQNQNIYPVKGKIKSYTVEGLATLNEQTKNRIAELLANAPEKVIGNNTLKIRMAKGESNDLGIWLLTFYEKVEFIVFLVPPENKNVA